MRVVVILIAGIVACVPALAAPLAPRPTLAQVQALFVRAFSLIELTEMERPAGEIVYLTFFPYAQFRETDRAGRSPDRVVQDYIDGDNEDCKSFKSGFAKPQTVDTIIVRRGWTECTDADGDAARFDAVLAVHPDRVQLYRMGAGGGPLQAKSLAEKMDVIHRALTDGK